MRYSQKKAIEIFNIVKYHLLKQKVRSTNKRNTQCLYRGPNNKKCAVGILIKNEQYHKDMERKSVETILNKFEQLKHLKPYLRLLQRLQNIHDIGGECNWNRELKSLEKELIERGYKNTKFFKF